MAETHCQRLSAEERRYALRVAQEEGPHRAFLLEKDISSRLSASCSKLPSPRT